MSDACVDPSALHLKKELTALRKARFLRDPETSSSWRSPLSSRSVAATSSRNYGNVFRGNSIATNNSCGLFELESNLLSRSEKNQKKVFLYNWRQHSSKSIDSGGKLDRDDGQGSVLEPYEKISQNAQKEGCNSDGYLKDLVFRSKAENPETRTRRTLGGLKKSSISKHRPVKKKSISMQLNLPSPSLCSASPSLSGYENWSRSSKILKSNRREEDSSYSYTPASTSSYIRHRQRKTSTIGSCDGNTTSVDGDEEDQLDLLQRRQVCGIPCYWSKRMNRSCGGCYSPSSHSDTSSRRKGGSIFRGSQRSYHRRRSLASHKRDPFSRSAQRLPLLTNSRDGGGSSIGTTSDELSTNYGELDLEGSSRLDGRRWSSCMSQEGLKLTLTVGAGDIMGDERILSQKYSPRSFDELVGQNIVVKSLTNTISGGRIAPVYLFQGPRGTGKTSTARIFAAALNCLSIEETKPCGFCRECTNFASGKSTDVIEVDATNKNGINRVGNLLKNLFLSPTFSSYKVFIINDCHMLSSKTWSAFLRFIEKPPLHVVFIFITTVPDNLPRSVVSRCRKYVFPKIKEADIVSRLKKLSAEENLDVESDALDLIALNSDGSLRDAETMLDQLSLLGKRITTSLVNDLVGVVSDEKLLDLLELAMSSDTAETVKRARELMDSGVDPMALMSQLERLIMDIIAGTYHLVDSKRSGYFCGRSLNEAELMRLKQSLKILSEAENQIRVSSENSTWFTAALLQLGSAHSPDRAFSSSSSQHSARKMKEDGASVIARETLNGKKKQRVLYVPRKSNSFSIVRTVNGHSSPNRNASSSTSMTELPSCSRYVEGSTLATTYKNITARNGVVRCVSPDKLDGIWKSCVERCHSKTLRHMLWSHGKLLSISEVEGVLIVFIGFVDGDIKSRAERFLSSITNSIELVLRHNVEIRLGLMPDGENPVNGVKTIELPDSLARMQMETIGVMEEERKLDNVSSHELNNAGLKLPRKGRNSSKCKLQETLDSCDGTPGLVESFHTVGLPVFSEEESTRVCSTREKSQEIPIQTIRAAIDEQRLESAWLQAAERSTPGSVNRVKPEKNQVMPQDGMSHQNQMAWNVSSKIWEEELNREINKALQISSNRSRQKGPNNKEVDYYAMSPSLLHDKSLGANFDKESLGYESGPACNGLICWKSTKPYKGKVKQATRVPSHKPGSFSLFGRCAKSKTPENW